MKQFVASLFCTLIITSSVAVHAQDGEWMTSLDVAQRLARRQNKMILMVWQDATAYPLPIKTKDKDGQRVFVSDFFQVPQLKAALWTYFVPVEVNELMYPDLFKPIAGKRSTRYINMFNDDSLKIMDANGNILATSGVYTEFLDLDAFVETYSIDTRFISKELENYAEQKDFYSTFYLAAKYVDFGVFVKKEVRKDVINLASIYIDEALELLSGENLENKEILEQRITLLRLKQDLILGKAKRVLRALRKMEATAITNNNKTEVAFLFYTCYSVIGDRNNASSWQNKVSSVNLKKAQLIVNINK